MLASDVPVLSVCWNSNASKFWHLRISRDFEKPEYYIGQAVLHKIKVRTGEILHPVTVIGIRWTGFDWEYSVEFPEDHPQFELENSQWTELNDWQLESM